MASVGAWLVALLLVARSQSESGAEGTARGSGRSVDWSSLTSFPALLTQAGLALWGAYVGWRAPSLSSLLPVVVVTALLVAISLVDLQVRRIPNVLVGGLVFWALVQVVWIGEPTAWSALLGLAVAGAVFLVVAVVGRGAMGWGDVKLEGALGAVLGFPLILSGLLAGAMAGGLAALILLATRRVRRKDYLAYGPYLALGAWFVWTQSMGLLW